MFDLGLWEVVVILAVGLIIIKPDDMPDLLRDIGKLIKKVKNIASEFAGTLNDISQESSINEVKTIIGDDGQHYRAFDVPLKDESKKIKNDSRES